MGISRDSRHKRRLTGGRRNIHQKKRKFELGRPAANTKLGPKKISLVRARGGNIKHRALRLESGNFSWGSEATTRKSRIIDVVYNSSNNELVRTKTLVKNCIIQVDATPFKQWYEQHYGQQLGKKSKATHHKTESQEDMKDAPKTKSKAVLRKLAKRNKDHELDPNLKEQFIAGRLYACVSSRPGQSGRCDGYLLEGKELEFYLRRMQKKK